MKLAALFGLTAAALYAQQFFAMDTALVRNLRDDRVTREDIQAVKRLGYSGLAMTIVSPEQVKHFTDNVLPWMDAEKVKLTALYWGGTVTRDGWELPAGLKAVLPLLKGRGTVIWFPINSRDYKPSDEAADKHAVAMVREVADAAATYGLGVSLYPHWRNLVERVSDAVRIAKESERSNVGVTMNLCHWLRVEGPDSLEAAVRNAAPHMTMASVNGADRDAKNWIQPLGEGDYNVRLFLDALSKAGYKGPIGLQGYSVAQTLKIVPTENLRRSMEAWRSLSRR